MAKIEIVHPAKEKRPSSTEAIEVRAWDTGGTADQCIYVGNGINFQANGTIWIEIIYSIERIQLFYTRTFIQVVDSSGVEVYQNALNKVIQDGEGEFIIQGYLPESYVSLEGKKFTGEDPDGNEHIYSSWTLEISVDTGVIFGLSSPGSRFIKVKTIDYKQDDVIRFMQELIHEMGDVLDGKHPDPGCLDLDLSEWFFMSQLNQRAYNRINTNYRAKYFDNPRLVKEFDGWLGQLPPGGSILDAGCGHGDPVIARLLERGYQVTGSDISAEMLERANQRFPQAQFIQKTTSQLQFDAKFDGICSFASLLYQDPIDFYRSIYRLHCALKPGGLLFLFSWDLSPTFRSNPYNVDLGEWMWRWNYGMEEAARRLEEHGYFTTVNMDRVEIDLRKEKKFLKEVEKEKKKKEAYERKRAKDTTPMALLPYLNISPERPVYGYVVIARRAEK